MALSASDQAAVLKAAQQGGLTSSQGNTIVSAANENKVVNATAGTAPVPLSQYKPATSTPSANKTTAQTDSMFGGEAVGSYNGATLYKNGGQYYTTNSQGGQTTFGGLPSGAVLNDAAPSSTPATTPPSAPGTSGTQTISQEGQTQQTQAGSLAMPANGSVVDLLNMAGQDSSFVARQQLAQQYGIQGYTGTASQNTELAQKYISTYNAAKGSAVPQNPADARNALQALDQAQSQGQGNPTQQFMDAFSSMNPIEANIFQQLSGLLSSTNTQTSLVDTYNQISQQENIPGLQLQLANLNTIMSGTEDDIRSEITNAGGFATESQVQALTTARNKTLLTQASYLQNALNTANDYVDRIVSLTQADRQQASQDLQQKLGIANTLVTMSENMQNAARDNIKTIVSSVGWAGLAQSLNGDPQATAKVENMLGLAPGGLNQLASYVKPLTQEETLQNQNLSLQNQKLQKDLNAPSGGADLQFVAGTANQPAGVFNKATGKFTPIDSPTGGGELQMALANSNIQQIDGLLASPGLAGSVGPNTLARSAPDFDFFTGVRSNFIAGVQQLSNQLTLTNLQNAKANGATFGALSEGELNLLSSSASKLNSWALKDGSGNVTGYNTSESNFKTELDKINNFAKLDYVLKGGSLSSVNVVQMQDGSLWTKNSDGTNVEIR